MHLYSFMRRFSSSIFFCLGKQTVTWWWYHGRLLFYGLAEIDMLSSARVNEQPLFVCLSLRPVVGRSLTTDIFSCVPRSVPLMRQGMQPTESPNLFRRAQEALQKPNNTLP